MIKHVTSIVISIHLLFIMLLLLNPTYIPVKRTQHVKVRTLRSTPTSLAAHSKPSAPQAVQQNKRPVQASRASAAQSASSQKQAAAPAPHVSPPSKKTPPSKKPAIIEKGKPVKKTEVAKKPEPKVDMWNEIDQALAKIEAKSYPKEKPPLDVPPSLTFLDEQTPAPAELEGSLDHSMESQLVGFLHDTLHLPEIGEVKIQLTVKKDGTVAKVVVVSAESRKNKLYLQQHLPLLKFPMQFDQEKTWTLTFYNEI